MNDGVLIQLADGAPFREMLDLTAKRHAAYCQKHNLDQWTIRGGVTPHALAWDKLLVMHLAMVRYKWVFYLDADTLITKDTDLRTALPDGADLGMTWQRWAQSNEPWHFNVGCIYARTTERLKRFWAALLPEMPRPGEMLTGGMGWHTWPKVEQTVLNRLLALPEWVGLCAKLDYKWNSIYNFTWTPDAVVTAWHGGRPGEVTLKLMRDEVARGM